MKEKLIWLCANHTVESVREAGEQYMLSFFPDKMHLVNRYSLFRIGLYIFGINAFYTDSHPVKKFMDIKEEGDLCVYNVSALRQEAGALSLSFCGDIFYISRK